MLEKFNIGRKNLFNDGNKTIYYDYKNNIAYFISSENESKFKLYYNRFLIAIIIAGLSIGFFLTPFWALTLSILTYVVLEILFNVKFLPTLSYSKNYDIETLLKNAPIKPKEAPSKTMLRCTLYTIFGILIVINAYQQQSDMIGLGLSYTILVFCLCVSAKQIHTLIKK